MKNTLQVLLCLLIFIFAANEIFARSNGYESVVTNDLASDNYLEKDNVDLFDYAKWRSVFPGAFLLEPTTTSLISDYDPSSTTSTITFTSTTRRNFNQAPVNAGKVSFIQNGRLIAGCFQKDVNNLGQSNCTTSLIEGTGTITAKYIGTQIFNPSEKIISVVPVPKTATKTELSSNFNQAEPAATIMFTSTVTTGNNFPVKVGTVSFIQNGRMISGCSGVVLSNSGQAICSTSLIDGTGTIVAKYNPASIFNGSEATINIAALRYRLGITTGEGLISNNERFEFSIGGNQKVGLDSTNSTVYFNSNFTSGQAYNIAQTSEPRSCRFVNPKQGVFADQDILVLVDCGSANSPSLSINISGIEEGESFTIRDNKNNSITFSDSIIREIGNFLVGSNYSYTQVGGPRQCRLTNNIGVMPNVPVTVLIDCKKAPSGNTRTEIFKEFDLVSRSSDDKKFGSFYDSNSPVIGGKGIDEGRYVAFVSSAVGLGNSSGKKRQIIWRDRKTGETRVASQGMNGAESDGDSFAPAISADGKSVAFESYATNLVPIDTNKVRDVFVWNFDADTISAVSDAPGNIETNAEAFEPTINGDGTLIAFSSSASTLTPGVSGTSTVNVFLKDMRSGSVSLLTKDLKTKTGVGGSRPSISEDGSTIAFYSYSDKLVEGDNNKLWDIFIWSRSNPQLKRISFTAEKMERDQGSESASRVVKPTISGDGKYVTFATTATNMRGAPTNRSQNVYIVYINSGIVMRASDNSEGAVGDGDSPVGQGEQITISHGGELVAFTTKASNLGGKIIVKQMFTGQLIPFDTESGFGVPALSQKGKCIVFSSGAKLDKRFTSSGIFVSCSE